MKRLSKIYMILVFAFLYAPIVIMMFFSFNEGQSLAVFSGFSLKWYKELFLDETARTALINTLILAVLSALISTVIGTFAALGIDRMRSKTLKSSVMMITQLPMVNPDIVIHTALIDTPEHLLRIYGIG